MLTFYRINCLEGVLDIVGRLAFGNRDIASMSKFKLDELLSNEFDAHCMHIEGWYAAKPLQHCEPPMHSLTFATCFDIGSIRA